MTSSMSIRGGNKRPSRYSGQDGEKSLRSTEPRAEIKWMSLPANNSELEGLYRQGYRHPSMKLAHDAMKMKRSPNKAFILLVGLSGAGKSSTVNYLFGKDIAKTSDSKSETRSTTEYIVTMESLAYKIPDIKLSIIDTPGFCDTAGLQMDAKNVTTIKYFLENEGSMKHRYPNLVFIVVSCNDNRIEGDDSPFTKMLNGVRSLNVIDPNNPNVVVIITHAASFGYVADIWVKQKDLKCEKIRALVETYLGITPEVVVQENIPDHFGWEKIGDWHKYPDDKRQPKELLKSCQELLNKSKDLVGHEAFSVCFRHESDQAEVKPGLQVGHEKVLETDVQEIYNQLIRAVISTSDTEVSSMLKNYEKEKNIQGIKSDIILLQIKLREFNIKTKNDIKSMTMDQLASKFHPVHINKKMEKILEDVFAIKYEQIQGQDLHIGKGYNIFKDKTAIGIPLKLGKRSGKYGTPSNVDLKQASTYEVRCQSFNSTDEFIGNRLRELDIKVDEGINFAAFNIAMKAGYNSAEIKSHSTTRREQSVSFAIEQVIYSADIVQPFETSKEFIDHVQVLPDEYNLQDEDNVLKWKAFFDKWGEYVVIGTNIGGSVTGDMTMEDSSGTDDLTNEAQYALALKLSYLNNQGDLNVDRKDSSSTAGKHTAQLKSTAMKWSGGDKTFYKNSLETVGVAEWKGWIDSLELSPAPLSTTLRLCPLYLLPGISHEKSIQIQKAIDLVLKGDFKYTPPKEDTRDTAAMSKESEGGCFPATSVVTLPNGQMKTMSDVSVGEKVLTVSNDGSIKEDTIIAWLHIKRSGKNEFLRITHERGNLTISSDHIVFVGEDKYPKHASSVVPGQKLNVATKRRSHWSTVLVSVLSVSNCKENGWYAPLTYSGRLLVDSVDVSCYCVLQTIEVMGIELISGHSLAHFGFLPLRLAYLIGRKVSYDRKNGRSEIHPYANWLKKNALGWIV